MTKASTSAKSTLTMHRLTMLTFTLVTYALITFAVLLGQADASEFKVASVNIDKILLHCEAADKELFYLKSRRDRYLKDRNSSQKKINALAIELKALQAKVKNKAMPRAERNILLKQRENLIAKYQSLTNEVQQSDDEQTYSTKQNITAATLRILKQCHLEINDYAKTHGYQWVLEKSGRTSSQTSPLIYARNAVDITDDILALLNKNPTPQ